MAKHIISTPTLVRTLHTLERFHQNAAFSTYRENVAFSAAQEELRANVRAHARMTVAGAPVHVCKTQCDRCHTQANCVEAIERIGELLLCAHCAKLVAGGGVLVLG